METTVSELMNFLSRFDPSTEIVFWEQTLGDTDGYELELILYHDGCGTDTPTVFFAKAEKGA